MPDRIIRDEIASSDRWLGLPRNTHRLAFLMLVLGADDLGNLEATPGSLWRAWRDPLGLTDRQMVAEILSALADAGLVRLYEVDAKRYAHIPRFRQRLRYVNGKHPRPPEQIECHEIKTLAEKSQTTVRLRSDHSQTTVRPQTAEVKRSEVKRSEVLQPLARAPDPVDNSSSGDQQPGTPHPVGDKSPKKKATPTSGSTAPPRPARGIQDREGIEALARYFGKWPLQGRAGQDWGEALEFVNRLRREHFGSEQA